MPRQSDIAEQIATNCLMGRTRLVSRVLSGIYDEELRPFGLQASQITSLAVIAVNGPVRRSDVGRWLHLDSSTLTRNLRVMLGNGWLDEVPDEDGRGRALVVTPRGRELLRELGPAWQRAQQKAVQLLGSQGRDAVMTLFDVVQQVDAA